VKGANSRYVGGRREWLKVKRRDGVEVIVGGVLGPIERPEVVIAGRYRGEDLVVVGHTVPLDAAQSTELGALLRPAGRDHPWPDEISSQRWGGLDSTKPLTKVRPEVVVEVLADAALQAGQWRHPLRFARYRADLQRDDVPALPDAVRSPKQGDGPTRVVRNARRPQRAGRVHAPPTCSRNALSPGPRFSTSRRVWSSSITWLRWPSFPSAPASQEPMHCHRPSSSSW
jgi:hypothetical protein